MQSNQELIHSLIENGVLHSPRIIQAFKQIDRADFVNEADYDLCYEDHPLPIGHGQTISQPFTVAFMLELLDPRQQDSVLDIGSGSGWTTALLATLSHSVIGLERIPELVRLGQMNLQQYDFSHASIRPSTDQLGIPGAQFDRILVSASAPVLPEQLLKQLKRGGRLVIPVGHAIWLISKDAQGQMKIRKYDGFVFVPLIESDA